MIARFRSAAILGVQVVAVEVEVDIGPGLPGTILVGLPNAALREARDRVRAAIRNAGLRYPDRKVVVSLAPADLRKEGPSFDLPIALAILMASGQCSVSAGHRFLALGELGLDGEVRPVHGVLAVARAAFRADPDVVVMFPQANAAEARLVEGLRFVTVGTLREAVACLAQPAIDVAAAPAVDPTSHPSAEDDGLGDIAGQEMGKRAISIVAAGAHNLLMSGPPGSGKTLLARRLPSLLPPLSEEESLEVTLVHGLRAPQTAGLVRRPPFRAPHHTISHAGLIGGGASVRPGEITLAHRGVLFLDELAEFPTRLLETLRQPIEEREVRIVRSGASVTLPADVIVVAAMNPCPCGYLGSSARACQCTPQQVRRYRGRISGPLLDRFDLQLELAPVDPDRLLSGHAVWASREREAGSRRDAIFAARERQAARFEGSPLRRNAEIPHDELDRLVPLRGAARALFRDLACRLCGSARSTHRLRRVSRTIADLEGALDVGEEHVSEAFQYRFSPVTESC